jgi:molecular chaperone GrpE
MLPVLDDFDRAMVEILKSEDELLLKGVELIHEKLRSTHFKGFRASRS